MFSATMFSMPSAREMLAALRVPDSAFIAGVHAHAADADIVAALKEAWALPDNDLIAWEIGVRNARGEIYRRAALKGASQVFSFGKRMAALGFVPEPEESEHEGSGFDIIFRDNQDRKRRSAPRQTAARP